MTDPTEKTDLTSVRLRRSLLGASVVVWPVGAMVLAGAMLSGLALAVTVMLISLAGLTILGTVVWRMCRPVREARAAGRRDDRQGGAAMLEFVMVLPILLMLTLMLAQSCLLVIGNLTVRYAALCAVRTAVVTVPLHINDAEPHNVAFDPDGAKLQRIRQAAVWAVLPVSSGSQELDATPDDALVASVANLLAIQGREAPAWATSHLERKLTYADRYTSVALADPENGDVYGDSEDLYVTVYHTYYLAVPYAARIYSWLDAPNAEELDFGAGRLGLVIRHTATLTNEGPADFIEPDTFD